MDLKQAIRRKLDMAKVSDARVSAYQADTIEELAEDMALAVVASGGLPLVIQTGFNPQLGKFFAQVEAPQPLQPDAIEVDVDDDTPVGEVISIDLDDAKSMKVDA